ncbi:MAG: hypothetical protein IJU70_04030 [Lentisphaeria bacterium]|nr:hypothetical protein [Lentisphaeria bacterium]
MKKSVLLLFAAAFLLLAANGCAWFRSVFNEPEHRDGPKQNSRKQTRRNRPEPADDRDPIHDMFKVKNKPEYMHDKELTPRERELLKQEMNHNDPERAVRDIRADYKTEKQTRRDWVFSR